MLIITRRVGESFRIGDNIVIKILERKHGAVGIGIDAPREIAVHREEVYQRIQSEKSGQAEQAAQLQKALRS